MVKTPHIYMNANAQAGCVYGLIWDILQIVTRRIAAAHLEVKGRSYAAIPHTAKTRHIDIYVRVGCGLTKDTALPVSRVERFPG